MLGKCKAVLAGGFLLLPAVANAACIQSDIEGIWQVYAFNTQDQWIMCKFNIAANGAIANTSCDASTGERERLTDGKVTLATPAVCKFTAEWKLGPLRNRVVHSTLNQSKNAGSGVGRAGNADFVFDIIKLN